MLLSGPSLVLVVEDQALIRMSLEEGLQDSGYDVIGAANGAEATGKITGMGGEIQALVTNVHLGGAPSGWDIARRSRVVDQAMPVIYTTASWTADWEFEPVPRSMVIAKPFAIEQILHALSTLFDAASGRSTAQGRGGEQ